METDIRWKQRFQNYRKAFSCLTGAVRTAKEHPLSDMEQLGLVKAFEFTFELSWNVMKDYLTMQGITGIIGSRDAVRQAFKAELITDGQTWMEMIDSRNLASHTYNGDTAAMLTEKILQNYYREFSAFAEKMMALAES
ncbi:MAG: nucleotidyltransferase substrate binding protein [Spirochaetales bacterium]|jgi:nucleotidyltransferase substrate binding protein (TIGR01987 family)|nr:nucleotidyltransferase substrate binding protein [Spirochaetales bacterium]